MTPDELFAHKYPEHAKLDIKRKSGEHGHIQEFITWLFDTRRVPCHEEEFNEPVESTAGVRLAYYTYMEDYREPQLVTLQMGDLQRGELIAAYFGVCPKKLEAEKMTMLEELRSG